MGAEAIVLALHVAGPGFILTISYRFQSSTELIPECKSKEQVLSIAGCDPQTPSPKLELSQNHGQKTPGGITPEEDY